MFLSVRDATTMAQPYKYHGQSPREGNTSKLSPGITYSRRVDAGIMREPVQARTTADVP